jgi:hypothetical protein
VSNTLPFGQVRFPFFAKTENIAYVAKLLNRRTIIVYIPKPKILRTLSSQKHSMAASLLLVVTILLVQSMHFSSPASVAPKFIPFFGTVATSTMSTTHRNAWTTATKPSLNIANEPPPSLIVRTATTNATREESKLSHNQIPDGASVQTTDTTREISVPSRGTIDFYYLDPALHLPSTSFEEPTSSSEIVPIESIVAGAGNAFELARLLLRLLHYLYRTIMDREQEVPFVNESPCTVRT